MSKIEIFWIFEFNDIFSVYYFYIFNSFIVNDNIIIFLIEIHNFYDNIIILLIQINYRFDNIQYFIFSV